MTKIEAALKRKINQLEHEISKLKIDLESEKKLVSWKEGLLNNECERAEDYNRRYNALHEIHSETILELCEFKSKAEYWECEYNFLKKRQG